MVSWHGYGVTAGTRLDCSTGKHASVEGVEGLLYLNIVAACSDTFHPIQYSTRLYTFVHAAWPGIVHLTSVQGVEGLLYLSSFGHYQIKASSAEALNDIITASSQLGGEARCRAVRAASTQQPWLCEERSSCWF